MRLLGLWWVRSDIGRVRRKIFGWTQELKRPAIEREGKLYFRLVGAAIDRSGPPRELGRSHLRDH